MSLQTLVSTLEQRALLTYVAPQFLGNPKLSLQLSALFDISHDIRTFSARPRRRLHSVRAEIVQADTLQYRFTYRKVNVLGTPLHVRNWFGIRDCQKRRAEMILGIGPCANR